ncbi:helix-turn-helix transcriptional regulator [Nitratireductor sp. ZSWI3]|uniref:helix-turn-helix transcriptional regulator n=1 Tax=Nitratireductor sp. ZSWI3 TaxID=2966359 RepID=UPI00214F8820|nr:AraC family transcriptional regulator [Nitratireductor sp. ZSWI3]MCR4266635.1 AraC family transcriptional regulator [Nitratireductor sp. ZSWI3]
MLKELLRKIGEYRTGDARSGRLVAVLQDELSAVSPSPLAMPWPADPRLCRIAETLLVDPADARGLHQWSMAAGMSRRTFCRQFRAETGLSFIEWRQQARLARAVELLRAGESVTATAMAVGYESVSAFVALFRARLGSPPRNFVRNREYE